MVNLSDLASISSSGTYFSASLALLPRTLARCDNTVSDGMTRSQFIITAVEIKKAPSASRSSPRSMTCIPWGTFPQLLGSITVLQTEKLV
jgi:hypothetical protein